MPSIYVFKRKKDGKPSKYYTAQIRFGEKAGGAAYLRSTGATDRREAEAVARRIAREKAEAEKAPPQEPPAEDGPHNSGDDVLQVDLGEGSRASIRQGYPVQVALIVELIGEHQKIRDLGNKEVSAFVRDAKLREMGPVPINRCLGRLRATMNYAALHWEEEIKTVSWMKMMQGGDRRSRRLPVSRRSQAAYGAASSAHRHGLRLHPIYRLSAG